MKFLVDAHYRFGSGDLAASMTLDGRRVLAQEWARGSCHDLGYATIPLATLRRVRKVELRKSAYPGGNFSFEGSGRQFVAQQARKGWTSPQGYAPRLGERGPLKEALLSDSYHWKDSRRDRAMELARLPWLREELARQQALSPSGDFAIKSDCVVKRVVEHDPGFRGKRASLRVKEEIVARAPYLL